MSKKRKTKNREVRFFVTVKGYETLSDGLFYHQKVIVNDGRSVMRPAIAEMHYNRKDESLTVKYTDGASITFGAEEKKGKAKK